MSQELHAIISGQVQGVGFRAFVAENAKRLGLSGWARNLPDGRVEVVVSGEDDAVAKMLDALRAGPAASEVTDVQTADWNSAVGSTFEVLPTPPA